MELIAVDRVRSIDPETFRHEYLIPRKPLIIEQLTEDWPARNKWNTDFFKQAGGHLSVPVYDNSLPKPQSAVNAPDYIMRFEEYLDRITSGPCDLRIFLFNIFNHLPELVKDFSYPDQLCKSFLKKYPMLFFGGKGSIVYLHYDMDLSHVFITQFTGKKRVLLFDNRYSSLLYRLPFMVQSYIDPERPDYEKYPGLKSVKGYETLLENGETLFMPSGIWHYMNYLEGGFALSLRSTDTSMGQKLRGLFNLTLMRKTDDLMKRGFTSRWYHYKHRKAAENAEKAISRLRLP